MLSNNEVTEGLLIAMLGANFVLLFFSVGMLRQPASIFDRLAIAIVRKMDCDELTDGLLSAQGTGDEAPSEKPMATTYLQSQEEQDRVQNNRERLASVAAGRQAGRYGLLAHGKALTASHIEELDDSEIERLYARYEARLGAAMTKTRGSAALQLYAGMVSIFLPIPAENQTGLIADLEGDPFVGHALSSATCELYHRYGMFLAPLTAALTTIKHCQFGHRSPAAINDGNQADGGDLAGSSGGTARSGAGTC